MEQPRLTVVFLILLFPSVAFAGEVFNPHTGRLDKCVEVREEDGSPSVICPNIIKFPNGNVTDNGDLTVSIADNTSAGGGSVNVSHDGSAVISADTINVTTGLNATGTSGIATISADEGTITTPGIVSFDTANFQSLTGRVSVKSGGIDLTDEVTGTLPTGSGGTGATTLVDLIALTTHTTGNYVGTLSSGSGVILGGYTDGEGSTAQVSVDSSTVAPLRTIRTITQTGHGFSAGDVLRTSGTDVYVEALASGAVSAESVGIVYESVDSNNFSLITGGYVDTLSGLTANSVYFLSDTTPGGITLTEPSDAGEISKPVLLSNTTTSGYFFNMRGVVVGNTTPSTKLYSWSASSTSALEPGDSIAALKKDQQSFIDLIIAAFDDSTDECRTVTFKVPDGIDLSGTVNFFVHWFADTATTGNVVWDVRWHEVNEGEDFDGSLTTDAATADAAQGTLDFVTETTWSETVSNLGWTQDEMIELEICRDADNASDTMTGDAQMMNLTVEIPRI